MLALIVHYQQNSFSSKQSLQLPRPQRTHFDKARRSSWNNVGIFLLREQQRLCLLHVECQQNSMVRATLRGEPFNSQRCVYPTALLVSFSPSKHSANIQPRNAPSYFILNQAAVPPHSTNTRTMTETTAESFSCSVLKFWPSCKYTAVPLLCSL